MPCYRATDSTASTLMLSRGWNGLIAWLVALGLAGLAGGRTATAQVIVQQPRSDTPVVTHIMPVALRAGEAAEFTLTGERLDELSAILCQGGVTLEKVIEAKEKQAKVVLRAAENAAPGAFPFHVLCKAGLSNPRLMRIDRLPQHIEAENNTRLSEAQAIAAPCGVSGNLAKADVDCFTFEVAAGQSLVFEVEAWRLGMPVRPMLVLFDEQGREIARTVKDSPDIAPDARLAHRFASTGKYVLRVTDRTYEGGPFCNYYLRIHDEPFATAMFPLGGRRGGHVSLTLQGGSLTAPLAHELDLAADAPWLAKRMEIPLQAAAILSPMALAVGDLPEWFEQEPNDTPSEAAVLDLPITVNGRIERARDRDCIRFRAKNGQKLQVRALSRSLGSPLDVSLILQNDKGETLQTADDTPAAARVPPVVRPIQMPQNDDDSLLEFTAPADGEYTVLVDDVYFHGGPEYAYRLEISEPRPDFELLMQPGRAVNPQQQQQEQQGQQVLAEFAGQGTGCLSIDRGGRGSLVVRVIRRNYNGPIELSAEGLPPGLTVEPATIAAGQNQAEMAFNADFDANVAAGFVRIVGTARFDESQPDQAPTKRAAAQQVVFAAMPSSGVVMSELPEVAIGISGRGAELALRAQLVEALAPGGKAKLLLKVRRREGYKGEVAIAALSLPEGLKLEPLKAADGVDELEAFLSADATLPPGQRSLQIEAKLTVEGKPEPVTSLATLQVDVKPLVTVELVNQQVDVPRGGTAKLTFKIASSNPRDYPIELAASKLPAGVTLPATTLPPGQDVVELEIAAAADASALPIRRIVELKPSATVNGQKLELPTLRCALKVLK